MDPFKLLSRSTHFSRRTKEKRPQTTPSTGRASRPQLVTKQDDITPITLGKRKRLQEHQAVNEEEDRIPDFFGHANRDHEVPAERHISRHENDDVVGTVVVESSDGRDEVQPFVQLPLEERRRLFKQHKVKATLLNPDVTSNGRSNSRHQSAKAKKSRNVLYPNPLQSFQDLHAFYGLSKRLSSNLTDQGYTVPTEVQLSALPLLLDNPAEYIGEFDGNALVSVRHSGQIDLLTVAPTGNGKTLAYMIPLLHSLLPERRNDSSPDRHTSAIILAPTKELAAQITNEGRKLARGVGLSVSQIRKGMKLPELPSENADVPVIGTTGDQADSSPAIKADILVSTPGILQSVIQGCQNPAWNIQRLVLDEADVLLDPLFREQTLAILNTLTAPELRISMWSATMGSNIEELARSMIEDRSERLSAEHAIELQRAPLVRLVVGLKDAAVPNVEHVLTYAATERGKLLGLRQLLHPVSSSSDAGPVLRPPFLVFTQTIERAIALHSELRYDIPEEAGGTDRIAVLHADLSDSSRDTVMARFRKGEIWILITTDLLSRGVDFRGINGVVNYDIPLSSAAYVHRIGRTGRAGRVGGVAVTLYSKEDVPFLKHVANVVKMAGKEKGADGSGQQWLLDALPKLSKDQKWNLKKHGIESKTARGRRNDAKASRKSRISSKSGFVRRAENNRRGAILGSQRRIQADSRGEHHSDESDFGGFG